MAASSKGIGKMIALLLALCAGLLAWMKFGLDPEFQRLSGAGSFLDVRLSGYDAESVVAMATALSDPARAEARDLLRFMYLGPDLVLPLAVTLALSLLMRGFAPGAVLYGRRLEMRHVRLLCLLPLAYGLVDYTENVGFLIYFPPATPGDWLARNLPDILPWITRVKLILVSVSSILVVRLAFFGKGASKR
ncbi:MULTISPECIES: hypothetical protein [Alphaproteobacteria]|uniref:Integral membrane protein n=2 Tax=Alphaproteobacteria TaxID=28211 RepID=A0A512HI88_9HYPH|nr:MULTISPECIES: hypothetical protein [Alphaproteobacteria]GEO85167.1 hypothetical protein RNA01_20990 [Ciceribacter naphthalenivorans]GLR24499.1 hypothetical protein GCM10007920_42930 [Ciceribacter naphthalenivorans]GLT07355.1 hypothetical protein GCM10007926_42930 [Sphingomonas psychrolutea]